MKKITYISLLLISIYFLGCTKAIDIIYNAPVATTPTDPVEPTEPTEPTDPEPEDKFSLKGVWDGTMSCPNCTGNKKYNYTLTVEEHNGENVKGTVKISFLEEEKYYIIFNISGTFKNGVLDIKTTGIKEEKNKVDGSSTTYYWCKDNGYKLNISEDKKNLNGTWTASSNCSYIIRGSSVIDVRKK